MAPDASTSRRWNFAGLWGLAVLLSLATSALAAQPSSDTSGVRDDDSGDPKSVLFAKAGGLKLPPGSALPSLGSDVDRTLVHSDFLDWNFRPPQDIGRPRMPLIHPSSYRLTDWSNPYGGGTAGWYDYFSESTQRGVDNPARRNDHWVVGGP